MFKLDPQLKAKWLEALRSRKYKQGTRYLKQMNDDGKVIHCCLGVLGELCNVNQKLDIINDKRVVFDNSRFYVPEKIIPKETQHKLAVLNDNKKHKFYQIARWIERNL